MNEQYIPIGRVARWSMILLAAIVVLDVIAALSDLAEIRLLDRIIEGEPVTDDEADASDTRQAVIGAVQFLVYAATAFVFIRWFRRAYRNLAPLGAERTRFKSWWTIAGWFIPIWNVFRPKQLLNDIWRGSDPSLPPRTDAWRDGGRPGALPALVAPLDREHLRRPGRAPARVHRRDARRAPQQLDRLPRHRRRRRRPRAPRDRRRAR